MEIVIKKIIIISCLFTLNVFSQKYNITFMGINAAKVNIIKQDTIYQNNKATKLEFSAQSQGIFNNIFPIKTKFINIINSNNQLLYFKRRTIQPNMNNQLSTNDENGYLYYNIDYKKEHSISKEAFTIFTFLNFLATNDITKIAQNSYLIDREGIEYSASIKIKDSNINNTTKIALLLKQINSKDIAVIEKTDVFTWAIFNEEAVRTIWINNQDEKIEKCQFEVGFFTLYADRIHD